MKVRLQRQGRVVHTHARTLARAHTHTPHLPPSAPIPCRCPVGAGETEERVGGKTEKHRRSPAFSAVMSMRSAAEAGAAGQTGKRASGQADPVESSRNGESLVQCFPGSFSHPSSPLPTLALPTFFLGHSTARALESLNLSTPMISFLIGINPLIRDLPVRGMLCLSRIVDSRQGQH